MRNHWTQCKFILCSLTVAFKYIQFANLPTVNFQNIIGQFIYQIWPQSIWKQYIIGAVLQFIVIIFHSVFLIICVYTYCKWATCEYSIYRLIYLYNFTRVFRFRQKLSEFIDGPSEIEYYGHLKRAKHERRGSSH